MLAGSRRERVSRVFQQARAVLVTAVTFNCSQLVPEKDQIPKEWFCAAGTGAIHTNPLVWKVLISRDGRKLL